MDEDLDDICYECTGYGDDTYIDDNGEIAWWCDKCWVTREKEKREEQTDDRPD